MQLKYRRSLLAASFWCFITLSTLGGAETTVTNLSCQGQIVFQTDSRVKQERLNVDLLLDIAEKRVKFSDMWGCVIDMAGATANSNVCFGALPVSVSDQEISFFKEQRNESYATTTSFTLNRYSGRLSVRSTAIALPASQAMWKLFMVNADLSCSPQSKKF